MTLFQAVRTILAADSALTALVGDAIRPLKLAQGDSLPAAVIEITDDASQESLADDSATGEAGLQVVCCAHTAAEAEAAAGEVRRVLDGYRGNVGGLAFDPITYQSTARDHDPPEDGSDETDWYYCVPKFSIWYRS